jgi:ectoine hydroxylase-related dioxygenase (phytanoyl-CoA dioxygenase family)
MGPEAAAFAEVAALGLERHAAELDANGYTIVPPEKVGPPEMVAALRCALLRLDEAQRGVPADLEGGTTHANNTYVADQHMFYLLLKDPVFEQALMNPAVLALATYLLGPDCVLHSLSGTIKGPSADRLALHTDNNLMPAPFPPYAQIVNVTLLLSDYSDEQGSTFFWPGSHRFARHPLPAEIEAAKALHGVTAPAGSLLIWNGGTWHGAAPRTVPASAWRSSCCLAGPTSQVRRPCAAGSAPNSSPGTRRASPPSLSSASPIPSATRARTTPRSSPTPT